jgi:hypothetical protein
LGGTLLITQRCKKFKIIWFGGLEPNNCSFWVETKNIFLKIVLCGCAHILKVCLKGVFNLTFGWGLNVKAFYCAIFLSFLDMKNMVSRFNLYHFHFITKIERKTLLQ